MRKRKTANEDELHSQYNLRTVRIRPIEGRSAVLLANYAEKGKRLIGEVRVKVKLTNALDEGLVRRGFLTADQIRSYEADALVDTGAIRSVLPRHIVQELGLATVRKTRARYANDQTEEIDVTEPVGIELMTRRTSEETLVLGSEVIIGQTVLESLDLLVDCVNLRVVPNPERPDQPVIKMKSTWEGREEAKGRSSFVRSY
jgi:clan AA aspartic protease